MSGEEPQESEELEKSAIFIPPDEETFFDKDHMVFYTDDSGDIKFRYALYDSDIFQDLLLTVLSGSINEGTIDWLINDLDKQGLKEDALIAMMVKKLLHSENPSPIIKPSNFR